MVRFPNVKVDPWFNDQEKYSAYKGIPDDAVFICAYTVFMNPFDLGESAYFRRTKDTDELWIATWNAELNGCEKDIQQNKQELFETYGCVVSAPSEGDIDTAIKTLLTHLFRSRVNYNFPSGYVRQGIVSEVEFNVVIQSLKNELDEYERQAKKQVSEVVKTAEALKLNPKPSGQGPYSWIARCPCTNHHLSINTKSDKYKE